jgi:nitroimidazol reductase NimA-like FMN-containing flavoprotein (pyridoxamine 5'-phosphate oxidase superfamily)
VSDARPVRWPDSVDEILGGDQTIMLAMATPANGAVLLPVTNFAVRDRDAGTVTAVNSSVGVSRKLERMRRNPRIALAYHTRRLGWTDRPEYVLVQGTASLSPPTERYVDTIRENFEKYADGHPDGGPLQRRWLRGWHLRVGVELAVERVVVWPGLTCSGTPEVYGTPLPGDPPPQRAPAKGTGPRLDHERAARRAARLPDRELGWVGSDGFPVVAPVEVAGTEERGILLRAPEPLVPPGGRRAGLTAHWFAQYNIGQRQRIHTGWLESNGGRLVYAPHTKAGYYMPASTLVYKLAGGAVTLWGLRGARRRGFMPDTA